MAARIACSCSKESPVMLQIVPCLLRGNYAAEVRRDSYDWLGCRDGKIWIYFSSCFYFLRDDYNYNTHNLRVKHRRFFACLRFAVENDTMSLNRKGLEKIFARRCVERNAQKSLNKQGEEHKNIQGNAEKLNFAVLVTPKQRPVRKHWYGCTL